MLNALLFEWKLLKKRNILYFIAISVLFVSAAYHLFFYYSATNQAHIGGLIETFFFNDIDKTAFLYYFLIALPVIVSSFYTWFTVDDRKAISNFEVRTNKETLVYARLIINFIVGFLFCFSLLICLALFTFIILWNKTGSYQFINMARYTADKILTFGPYSDVASPTLGATFFTHPYLYYFIYFLIISIYAGFQAVLSCLCSYFTNKKIFVILSSFVIHFTVFMAFIELVLPAPFKYYTILELLSPFCNVTNVAAIPYLWIAYALVFTLLTIICVKFVICKGGNQYGKS